MIMTDNRMIQLLIGIGLSKEQAKTYLAVLELGEATVQEIAKKSSVKRTSTYYILEQLESQGFAYKTKQRKKTFYIAEKPEELLESFRSRVEKFNKNITGFKAIENQRPKKPRVYLLEGVDGFKKVWQMIFSSGIKEYLIIVDPREMLTFISSGYITKKIIKEKLRLGIKSRQLVAFSEYAKEIVAKDKKENRISKILPHVYKISFTTIIFDDKVAFISPHRENLILIIESNDFSKTQRTIFEALWGKL